MDIQGNRMQRYFRRAAASLRRSLFRCGAVAAAARAGPAQVDAGLRPVSAHGAADRPGARAQGAGRGGGGGGVVWSADSESGRLREWRQAGALSTSRQRRSSTPPETRSSRQRVDAAAARGGGGGQPDARTPVRRRRSRRPAITGRSTAIATCGSRDSTGANAVQITTDGSEKSRIKYGTASWVYGEELAQRTAMWWSPDGKKLAFYRFDESKVPDFYLATNLTKLQDTLDVEAYPKPGVPNPVVDLYVYDVDDEEDDARRRARRQAVRERDVGYYVYA